MKICWVLFLLNSLQTDDSYKDLKDITKPAEEYSDAAAVDVDDMKLLNNVGGGTVDNINIVRKKFGQEVDIREDDLNNADADVDVDRDHRVDEPVGGDPQAVPEVWPELGSINHTIHDETKKNQNIVYKHTSCDLTAKLPSILNLGFGAKDARVEIVDNLYDGQGLENRGRAAQQPAIGISKRSCDWSEKSESEADWPIGEKKRDLLG